MKPLYRQTLEYAKANNEVEQFRESMNENMACRDYLDAQIGERFDGFHLPSVCAENTIEKYGLERTAWVVATTIQERKGDGRFSQENRNWAVSLGIPQTDRNYKFVLQSHSCLVDGIATQIQKLSQKK